MVDNQDNWVKKIFPELKPEEVEQAEFNLREFLNTALDLVMEINNKLENGPNGEGLASDDTNPDSKD